MDRTGLEAREGQPEAAKTKIKRGVENPKAEKTAYNFTLFRMEE